MSRFVQDVLRDVDVYAGGSKRSQRSAVETCNHLPSNSSTGKLRDGAGSILEAHTTEKQGKTPMKSR